MANANVPVPRRLGQEELEFEAGLCYLARTYLNKRTEDSVYFHFPFTFISNFGTVEHIDENYTLDNLQIKQVLSKWKLYC